MVAIKAGWLATLADGQPRTAAEIAAIAGGEPKLIGDSSLHEALREALQEAQHGRLMSPQHAS